MISGKLAQTIKQFGFGRTFLIVIKGIIKSIFRITWYPYYIMSAEIQNEIKLEEKYSEQIRKLEIKDLDNDCLKKVIDTKKRSILKERFQNQNIEGYGIFRDDMLIGYGWINYEKLEITRTSYLPLPSKSALLFDDYCHPAYRRQGCHYLITAYRMRKALDRGIKNVYSVVITYNIPSIKTFTKLGLKVDKKFTLFIVGKKEYCSIKEVF